MAESVQLKQAIREAHVGSGERLWQGLSPSGRRPFFSCFLALLWTEIREKNQFFSSYISNAVPRGSYGLQLGFSSL